MHSVVTVIWDSRDEAVEWRLEGIAVGCFSDELGLRGDCASKEKCKMFVFQQ